MGWERARGHDDLIERFRRAACGGRLGHAFLFVGPPGVGKHDFALELGKALLCEGPLATQLEACDRCDACRLIDAGTHPDLILSSKPPDELEFRIDAIRALIHNLGLKPARGTRRVAVLNDADELNEAAANCFLKTLEEPPPGSLLILVGTAADRQLPTIRSRCQVVAFAPLDDAAVRDRLAAAGVTDKLVLHRLAGLADGSPGRALALADPELWAFRHRLIEELLKPKPDGPELARGWMALTEAAGKEAAIQRRRAAQVLDIVIDAFRRAQRGVAHDPADPVESGLLRRLAERFGPDGLLARLERLLDAEAHIDRRVQVALLVEAAVDAMSLDATTTRLRAAPAW